MTLRLENNGIPWEVLVFTEDILSSSSLLWSLRLKKVQEVVLSVRLYILETPRYVISFKLQTKDQGKPEVGEYSKLEKVFSIIDIAVLVDNLLEVTIRGQSLERILL